MSDSPRWERESQEDLRPPARTPEETIEFDMAAAGLVDPRALSEPPEYGLDRTPRTPRTPRTSRAVSPSASR
jgi:hypothetical protein